MILLYICQWLVPLMWIWKQNPDNAAIPYLTALGDLLGTAFLYAAFCLLNVLKPEDLINHSSQQNQQEHQQQHQKSALELMSIPPIFSNNSVITSTNNSIDF
ncbi:unnamed protein product [Meloidogyne enterolobii]|uniref:Uncharacterized protein n=1 Tax=Meloidogyne enterolobii TaxID=390850 RepID=A0ACB1AVH6_MELEN